MRATNWCRERFYGRLAAECRIESPSDSEDKEGEENRRVEGDRSHGSTTAASK